MKELLKKLDAFCDETMKWIAFFLVLAGVPFGLPVLAISIARDAWIPDRGPVWITWLLVATLGLFWLIHCGILILLARKHKHDSSGAGPKDS